jgi:hypothetical protein
MIGFSCVMSIHMEMMDAVLKVLRIQDRNIPIIRCPKCLTFHAVLWYLVSTGVNVILAIATAFITSYIAIWFDLFLGLMDVWYEDIYNRIPEEDGGTKVHHQNNRQSTGEGDTLPQV